MKQMKPSLRQAVLFVVLLGASIVTAGTAIAHHGFADYDMTRHETYRGEGQSFPMDESSYVALARCARRQGRHHPVCL